MVPLCDPAFGAGPEAPVEGTFAVDREPGGTKVTQGFGTDFGPYRFAGGAVPEAEDAGAFAVGPEGAFGVDGDALESFAFEGSFDLRAGVGAVGFELIDGVVFDIGDVDVAGGRIEGFAFGAGEDGGVEGAGVVDGEGAVLWFGGEFERAGGGGGAVEAAFGGAGRAAEDSRLLRGIEA